MEPLMVWKDPSEKDLAIRRERGRVALTKSWSRKPDILPGKDREGDWRFLPA